MLFHIKFFLILFVVSQSPLVQSQSLTISYPKEGSKVDQYDKINFKSNSPVKDTFIPVIFIQDPTQQWWPYLSASNIDEQMKTWSLEPVQFGIEKDKNKPFRIQVIVISQKQIDDGIKNGNKTIAIEQNLPLSNSIMVFLRNSLPIKSNIVKVIRK